MKHYKTLTNTKQATLADFRTSTNRLKLYMQYYEYILYDKIWVLRVTDADTDRAFLKSKIALGQIHVPVPEVIWNQNLLLTKNID